MTHANRKYCTMSCRKKAERVNAKAREVMENLSGVNAGESQGMTIVNPTAEQLAHWQGLILTSGLPSVSFMGIIPEFACAKGIRLELVPESNPPTYSMYFDVVAAMR